MEDKICIRCQNHIDERDNYVKVTEYNKGKEIKYNYMHKNCWVEMMNSRRMAGEAMGILKGVTHTLRKQGILPEKEVVVA